MTNPYYCSCCNRIQIRESDKKTIKSYCEESHKYVRLKLIEDVGLLARKLRRKYLNNMIDTGSFKEDKVFLEMAFEQGVTVLFNSINR